MTAPESARELFLAGNALFGAGDLSGASECYRRALQLDPGYAEACFNLGCTLDRLSGPAEALPHLARAVELSPEWSRARGSLGFALARLGRMGEAASELAAAVRLDPGDPGLSNNLGLALSALSRGEEAKDAFEEAIRLDPLYAEPHNNLSILFERFGESAHAIAAALEALRLKPEFPEAHLNLANALKSQGRHQEAIAHYREALRLRPDYPEAESSLLFALLYPAHTPEEELFAEHAAFGARCRFAAPRHLNDPDPERPLKLGYLSADFREHAVARFIEPVLARHDRALFQVYCYSNVPVPDQRSEKLASMADCFRNIAGMTDQKVEELVRADGIDILVDLSGHSAGNRLPVFARRPAPVQVTWLGYPFSTGLDAIDYRITDAVCDPPGETERYHSEELLRLPGTFSCFLPPDDAPPPGPAPCITSGRVTFGSFNNPAKITPETVLLWSGVLRAVPGSQLLLKGYSLACAETRLRLEETFAGHGIERERLELLGNTPSYRDHLSLYDRVDIALDSYPYNGTTTTCEALWMGVPVVTLAGSAHRSRVGASILQALGLEGLVAHEARKFVVLAQALAGDRERLSGLRTTLRQTMAASPLTDGASFTRHLEKAWRDIWGRWCRSHPAQAPDPAVQGAQYLQHGRLDRALSQFLIPLRGGERSTLGGIQEALRLQLAADQARALALDDPLAFREEEPEHLGSETLAETAELLVAAGFVTPAELICRYLGDRGCLSPRVSRTLAEVALAIGKPEVAVREFEHAQAAGDRSRATRIKLVKAQEAERLSPPPERGERFLLIKAWGYGFWSDVNMLLGQCLLAEITGRVPVVHWGGNSLFSDDPGKNAFLSFFLPFNGTGIGELAARARSFYPPKWNRENLLLDELNKEEGPWSRFSSLYALERGEEVVVGDFHYGVNDLIPWIPPEHPLYGLDQDALCLQLYRRYLRPKPELEQRAEAFFNREFSGRPVLALHVRGGDKGGEDPGLHRLNALYHPRIERFLSEEREGRLFLLTDDEKLLSSYRERYGDRLSHTVSTRTGSSLGVHYQEQADRRALGEEVLVDALIASRCHLFLGNGFSNVSLAVAQMKQWEPGSCVLFGARLDRVRQMTLYRS
ncbi:TPR domain protein [Citrifermentans bemidjiense Bem]|uniref:protein O-GlcNAc transferase n=1 Tax=Citrifermentans bemidjiense (strain ATCC BAA-1014 / DSM 16622 / JCM 12645 / Bem) TaxID=404380 RepID=B5EDV5_CITBB|nr:tetratricopeptide repeat protein [Citrifermentans bemidjiense]ACH40733.1 TPR domain protein [Citrifermentans bemidjiense Bem]